MLRAPAPLIGTLGVLMKLLDKLYAGPRDLLDKAKRDGDTVIDALAARDEVRLRDTLFNFSVTSFHICDWIKVY